MNKMDKINHLLSLLANSIEEIVETTERVGIDLQPEEIIMAALELVMSSEVEYEETLYSTLIANIDRTKVSFYLGDDMTIPLYEEQEIEYEDEDNLY